MTAEIPIDYTIKAGCFYCTRKVRWAITAHFTKNAGRRWACAIHLHRVASDALPAQQIMLESCDGVVR